MILLLDVGMILNNICSNDNNDSISYAMLNSDIMSYYQCMNQTSYPLPNNGYNY